MKSHFAILLVILGVVGLAGCATSSHEAKLMEPVKAGNPASLDFNFILVTTTNLPSELAAENGLLRDHILSGLREMGSFASVEETNANAVASGIKILAYVRDVTKVSKDSRQWYGGLAGRAQVVVHATVSDLATDKPAEIFEVIGKTGASAWAGTTDEAIQQAAAKVVAEVVSLNSQAARQLSQ